MADAVPVPPPGALRPVSVRWLRCGYASGNLAKSIVWTTFETILLYYLVAIAGLSPVLAGGTLAVTMLLDAAGDLCLGYLIDRHGLARSFHRIAAIAAPLGGMGFAAVFAATLAGRGIAPAITVAACLLCRGSYTLCDVAHNALLVRASPTPRDAGFVSGLRLVFSALGAALVGAAATVLLALPAGTTQKVGFLAAAGCGGMVYALLVPAAVDAAMRLPVRPTVRARPDLRRTTVALVGHAGLRRLIAIVACQAGLVPLFAKGLPFVLADAGLPGRTGTALFALTLAQVMALPMWMAVVGRAGPRPILIAGHLVLLLAMLALALLPGAAIFDLVAIVGAGIGIAGMNLAVWAMIALAVRDCAERTGMMLETVTMSLFLFVLKIAAALATSTLALMLVVQRSGGIPIVAVLTLAAPALGAAACLILAWRSPAAMPSPQGVGAGRSRSPAPAPRPSCVRRHPDGRQAPPFDRGPLGDAPPMSLHEALRIVPLAPGRS